MKLEVGMYVRTKYGISKIEEDRRINYGLMHPVVDILKKEVIIKASHNIIDLIEEGDYVNGKKVDDISFVDGDYFIKTKVSNTNNYDYLPAHLIKSIVTKEQFESMSYKVGD